MRLALISGLACLSPIALWVLVQINDDVGFSGSRQVLWFSQELLFFCQACCLVVLIPLVARQMNSEQILLFLLLFLSTSFPFSLLVWFSTFVSVDNFIIAYGFIFLFSLAFYLVYNAMEDLIPATVVRQISVAIIQLSLFVVIFKYRDELFSWLA